MKLFFPIQQATILIPTNNNEDKHLFVLLTNPSGPEQKILLVGISSARAGCDPSCFLFPGDHPFIRHKSFAYYARARITPQEKIISGVDQGLFKPKEIMPAGSMARIVNGLFESPYSTPACKDFYTAASS
ncbi:hypothetical protein [Zhongshania sp.]|uniref:hypothetical protein n=1 Tax=Zhongshania sp. TaxID=1971902 RepID=UPI0035640F79